ncbi:MAG: DNA cytosine methyltransferase [PVC group bacterium]|nr:DNA cytosine methyltransferase [PVC group bacterium]
MIASSKRKQKNKQNNFKFIDLFSGIGGFHYGLKSLGGKCVAAVDIDEHANQTYKRNFGIDPTGDITKISASSFPEFDLLCAGFPCQSFSNIGPGGGLKDHRGALIYNVFRILNVKKPKVFILENVKGLEKHNKGETLSYIKKRLVKCGYKTKYKVLSATDYGLPQIRRRLFIVGIRKDLQIDFEFPEPIKIKKTFSAIMRGKTARKHAFTIRIGGRRSGINNRFNWDCYIVDGKPRYITPKECLQVQGFPRNFYLAGPEDKQFKQVGNSVPVTIVREIGKELLKRGIV